MARILLVEDDKELATAVVDGLSQKYEVHAAADISSAKGLLTSSKFDLMLLDVTLPDGSGVDFYESLLKEKLIDIPVIFLTGQYDSDTRMKSLALGAQDYILKPYYMKELTLRIEMRLKQFKVNSTELICGDLKFEKELHRVSYMITPNDPQVLNLTPNEYKIFALLAASPTEIFSRTKIVDSVWGHGFRLSDKAVNTHISNLRKKIPSTRCKIVAVDGKGYTLTVD